MHDITFDGTFNFSICLANLSQTLSSAFSLTEAKVLASSLMPQVYAIISVSPTVSSVLDICYHYNYAIKCIIILHPYNTFGSKVIIQSFSLCNYTACQRLRGSLSKGAAGRISQQSQANLQRVQSI